MALFSYRPVLSLFLLNLVKVLIVRTFCDYICVKCAAHSLYCFVFYPSHNHIIYLLFNNHRSIHTTICDKICDSIYALKNLLTIIRDVYWSLHLPKWMWKWKNPGFTAEVLVQFHSPDGNRSSIDENSWFFLIWFQHIILPLGRLHQNRNIYRLWDRLW